MAEQPGLVGDNDSVYKHGWMHSLPELYEVMYSYGALLVSQRSAWCAWWIPSGKSRLLIRSYYWPIRDRYNPQDSQPGTSLRLHVAAARNQGRIPNHYAPEPNPVCEV